MPRSRLATRLKIVEGGYELFYKQGFARVSMDAIAASAGITKRTLYAHYDSNNALLADVHEHPSALALGRAFKSLLPAALRAKVPDAAPAGIWPIPRHPREMLVLEGCVQPSLAPNIDASMARVLDRIGISLLRVGGGGCCGALPYHLDQVAEAKDLVKRNIDAWWPHVERGAEAIIVTASGCGVMVKDYGHLLQFDPAYADKAKRIAELARDTVEVISAEWRKIAPMVAMDIGPQKVAFHPPCTLQHGMQIRGQVEEILLALGLELVPVADAHLCCGSAGTYSVLQPLLAARLRANKLAALEAGEPDVIASANIGCLTHLASGTARPVRHWIELLDARMVGGVRAPQ
jgi:glycolate oxidase iron-sulfur subunit